MLEVPPVPFLAAMAASGAALGPILDGFHSHFGVLRYHDPPPFAVFLPGTSLELCQTAVWVPPLFGLAGMIIGGLYVLLDQVLGTAAQKRRPALPTVLLGIGCFVLQYYLSGLALGPAGIGIDRLAGELFLWVTAAAHWWIFDCTQAGLVVCAMTALGGPLIEVALLNAPGTDFYAYAMPDVLGIPTWIAAVYFCGAPAVGNLARATLQALRAD